MTASQLSLNSNTINGYDSSLFMIIDFPTRPTEYVLRVMESSGLIICAPDNKNMEATENSWPDTADEVTGSWIGGLTTRPDKPRRYKGVFIKQMAQ